MYSAVNKDHEFCRLASWGWDTITDTAEKPQKDVEETGFLQALEAVEWVCGPGKQDVNRIFLRQFENLDVILLNLQIYMKNTVEGLMDVSESADYNNIVSRSEVLFFSIPEARRYVCLLEWLKLPRNLIVRYCVIYARNLGQIFSGNAINLGSRGGGGLLSKFLEGGEFKHECFEMLLGCAPELLGSYLAYLGEKSVPSSGVGSYVKTVDPRDLLDVNAVVRFMRALFERREEKGLKGLCYKNCVKKVMGLISCDVKNAVLASDGRLDGFFAIGGGQLDFARDMMAGGRHIFEAYIEYLDRMQEPYDPVGFLQMLTAADGYIADHWRPTVTMLIDKLQRTVQMQFR